VLEILKYIKNKKKIEVDVSLIFGKELEDVFFSEKPKKRED
jgi:hypothetical protein